MIGKIVYILCALTSLGCTLLLISRYRKYNHTTADTLANTP